MPDLHGYGPFLFFVIAVIVIMVALYVFSDGRWSITGK